MDRHELRGANQLLNLAREHLHRMSGWLGNMFAQFLAGEADVCPILCYVVSTGVWGTKDCCTFRWHQPSFMLSPLHVLGFLCTSVSASCPGLGLVVVSPAYPPVSTSRRTCPPLLGLLACAALCSLFLSCPQTAVRLCFMALALLPANPSLLSHACLAPFSRANSLAANGFSQLNS